MTPSLIARMARDALISEVNVTPKPGLVDRNGSGAHKDMDISLFLKSAYSLEPFFEEIAGLSQERAEGLFPKLRQVGMRAEKAMFEATGGVNTHKGAIFSIGLICSAAAYTQSTDTEILCGFSAGITSGICETELFEGATNGQKAFLKSGAKGARGEACSGFESVRLFGLPVYESELASGKDHNYAAVKTLISLIANVRDTNVISRGGQENEIRSLSMAVLDDFSLERVIRLGEEFVKRNVSPGGCADLLAVTFLLHELKKI